MSSPTSPAATAAPQAASPITEMEKDDAVPPITSPTSPPSTTASARPPPIQKQELSSNPKIAELQSIFPTVDVSVIELVLFETCGGSSDRAIEQLLGMTDENFRPDELERTRQDSQVDLDAEFARSLQLQDEEDLRRQQQQQQSQVGGGGSGGGLPYQPRVRRARPAPSEGDAFYQPQQQQYQQGYQNRDTQAQGAGQGGENPPGMLALEDKLEKYAEVGKQTFNSLLSRAKAKYSEYQASQAQRTNTNYSTPTAQGGGGGYGDRYAPGGSRGGEQGRGLWGDMNAHSPSIRSESISSESTLDPPYQQQPQAQPIRGSNRWQPTDTYDDPLPPHRGAGITSPNRIDVVGRASPNASMGGRGSPGIGSPEKGKIDPAHHPKWKAKLGILPKKKVDLFSTSPNQSNLNTEEEDPNPSLPNAHQSLVSKIPQTPPASSDNRYRLEDSDDELEYTKNPFDEK